MFNTKVITYGDEEVEAARRFTEHLKQAMGEIGDRVRQKIGNMIILGSWYSPSKLAKRRGVRGRALALKWRRK